MVGGRRAEFEEEFERLGFINGWEGAHCARTTLRQFHTRASSQYRPRKEHTHVQKRRRKTARVVIAIQLVPEYHLRQEESGYVSCGRTGNTTRFARMLGLCK